MQTNSRKNKNASFPLWPIYLFYVAGCAWLELTDGSSSICRALLGYPLVAVFPAFFLITATGGAGLKMKFAVPAALMMGPLLSNLAGNLALLLKADISLAAPVILLMGVIFGAISIVRRFRCSCPPPDRHWLPVVAFMAILLCVAIFILTRSLKLRLIYEAWFHTAVAYRVIYGGIPPEDPISPGMTAHNYWFYHSWAAILSWAFRRPPADMFAFINVHALAGVIMGVWAGATEMFRKRRERLAALLFGMLAMNALGAVFMVYNYAVKGVVTGKIPHDFLIYMVIHGDYRITHFLDKFVLPSAFPLGINYFVCCVYLVILLLKAGFEPRYFALLALSTLGTFLFHPTSGMGLAAGAAAGLFAALIRSRDEKRIYLAIAGALILGGAVSLPYLFSIFPFRTERIALALSGKNLWTLVASYMFMAPFIIMGIANTRRSGNRVSAFITGLFLGLFAAALFLKLPGKAYPGGNQYKFVQLLSIPVGFLSAWAFKTDSMAKVKKVLAGLFIALSCANTAILVYGYATSEWSRGGALKADGIHIDFADSEKPRGKLYRWIRESAPTDAVLVVPIDPLAAVTFSERPVLSLIEDTVSLGQKGEKERVQFVNRLFKSEKLPQRDIDALKSYNRPIYIILAPKFARLKNITARFDGRPDLFKVVYSEKGCLVYVFPAE